MLGIAVLTVRHVFLHSYKAKGHMLMHRCGQSYQHTTRSFKTKYLLATEESPNSFLTKNNASLRIPAIPPGLQWALFFSGNPHNEINASWITNSTINQKFYGP